MRANVFVVSVLAAAAALLALEATAQEPRPSPKHIEVPDPGADLGTPAPASADPTAPAPAAPTEGGSTASASSGPPRRGHREVKGDTPAALSGRYEVVQVTEAGETEDFRIKMERAGRALNQDCITVGLVFDFGEPSPGLPGRVRILERQECYKGGFGRYGNELALELPATWARADVGAAMTLPEVRATASLVRIKQPEGGGRVPQWLGPETKVDRGRTEYKVLVEAPKRGNAGEPEAVHLAADGVVLHLEPKTPGGPFADDADRKGPPKPVVPGSPPGR